MVAASRAATSAAPSPAPSAFARRRRFGRQGFVARFRWFHSGFAFIRPIEFLDFLIVSFKWRVDGLHRRRWLLLIAALISAPTAPTSPATTSSPPAGSTRLAIVKIAAIALLGRRPDG